MFGRFTERARKVLSLAEQAAISLYHNYVGTEHILLGLVKEGQGVAARVLADAGITEDKVLSMIRKIIGEGKSQVERPVSLTPRSKKILNLSMDEARRLGHNYIGTEHLLLGLIREGEGVAVRILVELGGDLNYIQNQIIELLGGQNNMEQQVGEKTTDTPNLDEYSRDLTKMAREGKLDPVIGRDKEIERVVQILSRRTKNNPVLIGEPGVGKTAIADGLAQRIISDNVPAILLNKRVVALDLSSIVAGSKYR